MEASLTSRRITLTATSDLVAPEPAEPGAQRRFGLMIFCDGESQLRLLEDGKGVVIGRKAPSEVVVDDSSVSHQHVRFIRKSDEVWAEDLDSRNGTFLDGQRITRESLRVGAEIVVGRARVVLAATATPEASNVDSVADSEPYVIRNAKMKLLYEEATRSAQTDVPVLVLGETGVGKEHVAHTIHERSARRTEPFVVVNCAAIPPSLVESALFGHERGAFTGAGNRSTGLFERAHGGVLFLDEIGELSTGAQAALLRAVETRKICRVGSSSEIDVNIRIVAATNCDLETMIEDGTFRSDLYFRLNTVALQVPALRERLDEIEPLVRLFLSKAQREWKVVEKDIAREAMDLLVGYSWPGNVRQLRHAVERAVLLGRGSVITAADLPDYVSRRSTSSPGPTDAVAPNDEYGLRQNLQRYERVLIEGALQRAAGNRTIAAKLLRMPMRTLFRKLRTFDGEKGGVA